MRPIPETANRADWPRLVSRAINSLAAKIESLPSGPTPTPTPTPGSGEDVEGSYLAGESIGALKAVYVNSSQKVRISDKDQPAAVLTIGISLTAATLDAPIDIAFGGKVSDSGWSWTAGDIWLGSNGQLTQTIPTTGALFRLGIATGAQSMMVEPQLVAVLGELDDGQ